MKTKFLRPIPKSDGPLDLNKLRPIMLLEPLRKVWTSCFIRPIRKAWETHSALRPQQYGFRPGRSCESPIIQLLNNLEHSAEFSRDLFMSTWDIRRAFDSVSRPTILMALERLGVPHKIALYLSHFDVEDTVTLLSPHQSRTEAAQSFSTGRGSGQGDGASTAIWTAVFDIILTGLAHCINQQPPMLFPLLEGNMGVSHPSAYADDLFTYANHHHLLQEQADIVCAFTGIMDLTVVPSKLRTLALIGGKKPPPLLVHDIEWTPTAVPFQTKGNFKYLGSTQDLDFSGISETHILKRHVRETLERLSRKGGTPEIFIRYIQGALVPKLVYVGMFHPAALASYDTVDKLVAQFLKKLLHLPPSHPNALLYGPVRDGGLNLPRPSTAIQLAKLRLILRLQRSDRPSRDAIQAILYRHWRHSSAKHSSCYQLMTGASTTWLSSLLDFLQQDSISLLSPFSPHTIFPRSLRPGMLLPTPEQGYISVIGWSHDSITGDQWSPLFASRLPRRVSQSVLALGPTLTLPLTAFPFPLCVVSCSVLHRPSGRYLHHLGPEVPLLFTHPAPLLPPNIPSPLSFLPSFACTDGAWKDTSSSIFYPNYQVGHSIVVMRGNTQLHTEAWYQEEALHPKRAFLQELLAIVKALSILPPRTPIHSDCKSAIAFLCNPGKPSHPLYPIHCAFATLAKGRLHWVKAHTDRSLSNPNCFETGNAHADRIASRHITPVSSPPVPLIPPVGTFLPCKAGQIILSSPGQNIHSSLIKGYLRDRQERYGGTVEWLSIDLGRLTVDPSLSTAQRGARQKLFLARFERDRLLRLALPLPSDRFPPCSCGCRNHLSTWISSCLDPSTIAARQAILPKIKTILSSLPGVFTAMARFLDKDELFWRGALQPEHKAGIEAAARPYGQTKHQKTKAIDAALNAICDQALHLYSLHSKQMKGKTPVQTPPAPPLNALTRWLKAPPPPPLLPLKRPRPNPAVAMAQRLAVLSHPPLRPLSILPPITSFFSRKSTTGHPPSLTIPLAGPTHPTPPPLPSTHPPSPKSSPHTSLKSSYIPTPTTPIATLLPSKVD